MISVLTCTSDNVAELQIADICDRQNTLHFSNYPHMPPSYCNTTSSNAVALVSHRGTLQWTESCYIDFGYTAEKPLPLLYWDRSECSGNSKRWCRALHTTQYFSFECDLFWQKERDLFGEWELITVATTLILQQFVDVICTSTHTLERTRVLVTWKW